MVDPYFWKTSINPLKLQLLDQFVVGKEIADVGCGAGGYSHHLSQKGYQVIGIDAEKRLSPEMTIPFVETRVPPIPLSDKCVDTLVMFDLLEHIEQEAEILQEIKRVTRQRIILSVPSDNDGILPSYGACLLHHVDKTHVREYSAESLTAVLQHHGFKVVHLKPQYPKGIPFITEGFFVPTMAGKAALFMHKVWTRTLSKLGLIKVELPADWFVVADVP